MAGRVRDLTHPGSARGYHGDLHEIAFPSGRTRIEARSGGISCMKLFAWYANLANLCKPRGAVR